MLINQLFSERDGCPAQVTAAAKAGAVAQVDFCLEAGPTTLEPTQTGFFQALGIATKITKGTIEIISKVQLCTKGEKVGSSEAVLLAKMGKKPFEYGLQVVKVFQVRTPVPQIILARSRVARLRIQKIWSGSFAFVHWVVISFTLVLNVRSAGGQHV